MPSGIHNTFLGHTAVKFRNAATIDTVAEPPTMSKMIDPWVFHVVKLVASYIACHKTIL